MINRDKKIETVTVVIHCSEQPNLTFQEILNHIFEHENVTLTEYSKDTDVKLLNNGEENFMVGIVNTTKRAGIPPKRNSVTKEYEAIDIDSDQEGLGYPNVFLFEYRRRILMYEFNRNGCYLNYFKRYLEIMGRRLNDNFPSFEIEFLPVLKEDAHRRMTSMTQYKKVDISIAYPNQIQTQELHNEALRVATRQAVEAQSKKINLEFVAGRGRMDGLDRGFVTNLIDATRDIFNRNSTQNVKRIRLDGFYLDPEDQVSKRGTIDFILDRYKKSITISEPNVLTDNQEDQRLAAIQHLYRRCTNDFDTIFG